MRPPAVIPEIDIWRAAQLMIRQYGQHAGDQAVVGWPATLFGANVNAFVKPS